VITSGQMDLMLKNCYAPVDSKLKNKINIKGEFTLKNVMLEPGGVLKELLNVSGYKSKPVSITNEVVSFVCRDGRIESTPLKLGNRDYQLNLAGYVTLDGMMKYTAQVPVSEKMVGKDAIKYLHDVIIKVPIEGPVAKPRISVDAIKKATAGLVKDAAKNVIKEEGGKLLKEFLKRR